MVSSVTEGDAAKLHLNVKTDPDVRHPNTADSSKDAYNVPLYSALKNRQGHYECSFVCETANCRATWRWHHLGVQVSTY